MASTTEPYIVNPFSDTPTADDPRELAKQIYLALGRARNRPPREPLWEEPGLHGNGRQVNLRRGRVPAAQLQTSRYPGASGRLPTSNILPPLPRRKMPAGQTAAIVIGGVAAVGLFVWWMKKRHDAASTHVGEDACGFDLLCTEDET